MHVINFQKTLSKVISNLQVVHTRAEFFDPDLFDDVFPLSDSSSKKSQKKTEKLISAYQNSLKIMEDALNRMGEAEQQLATLKAEIEKARDDLSQSLKKIS